MLTGESTKPNISTSSAERRASDGRPDVCQIQSKSYFCLSVRQILSERCVCLSVHQIQSERCVCLSSDTVRALCPSVCQISQTPACVRQAVIGRGTGVVPRVLQGSQPPHVPVVTHRPPPVWSANAEQAFCQYQRYEYGAGSRSAAV